MYVNWPKRVLFADSNFLNIVLKATGGEKEKNTTKTLTQFCVGIIHLNRECLIHTEMNDRETRPAPALSRARTVVFMKRKIKRRTFPTGNCFQHTKPHTHLPRFWSWRVIPSTAVNLVHSQAVLALNAALRLLKNPTGVGTQLNSRRHVRTPLTTTSAELRWGTFNISVELVRSVETVVCFSRGADLADLKIVVVNVLPLIHDLWDSFGQRSLQSRVDRRCSSLSQSRVVGLVAV